MTKVIQNFENTKVDVSNNLGGLEPITTIAPHAEIVSLQDKGELGAWLPRYALLPPFGKPKIIISNIMKAMAKHPTATSTRKYFRS